jgi:hypothetical protein
MMTHDVNRCCFSVDAVAAAVDVEVLIDADASVDDELTLPSMLLLTRVLSR